MRHRATILCAGWLLVAAACGPATPRPTFSNSWPEKVGEPRGVHRAWTRSGVIWDVYDKVVDAHATFKSPEWRAASVERRARRGRLTRSQRDELIVAEKKADAESYEVELLISAHDERENDFARGKKSIWRITLIDEQGNAMEPIDIDRERRTTEWLREEYPDMGDFAVAYVVRFARTHDLFAAGAKSFRLRISGERGAVDLVWTR